jgi:hypothetical protein
MSQVAFAADPKLQKEAKKKLKQDGITMKAFLTNCMREYVNGNLGMTIHYRNRDEFTRPTTQQTLSELDQHRDFLQSLAAQ